MFCNMLQTSHRHREQIGPYKLTTSSCCIICVLECNAFSSHKSSRLDISCIVTAYVPALCVTRTIQWFVIRPVNEDRALWIGLAGDAASSRCIKSCCTFLSDRTVELYQDMQLRSCTSMVAPWWFRLDYAVARLVYVAVFVRRHESFVERMSNKRHDPQSVCSKTCRAYHGNEACRLSLSRRRWLELYVHLLEEIKGFGQENLDCGM